MPAPRTAPSRPGEPGSDRQGKRNKARFVAEHSGLFWSVLAAVLTAVLAWGVLGHGRMLQQIPEHMVTIVCPWPGVRAEKVERLVTRPIAQLLSESGAVEPVESVSAAGMSVVRGKLCDGASRTPEVLADLDLALTLLMDVPTGAGPPVLLQDSEDAAELMLLVDLAFRN